MSLLTLSRLANVYRSFSIFNFSLMGFGLHIALKLFHDLKIFSLKLLVTSNNSIENNVFRYVAQIIPILNHKAKGSSGLISSSASSLLS